LKIEDHSILAWVGEDEHGSGVIGIKQARVPAGLIPLAAMDYDAQKLQRAELILQLEAQAATFGKKIRLVRFRFEAVVDETEHGN
jgi:hypothetical protein